MLIQSSGKQGASALIFTGICRLIGVSFTGDIANIPTLTIYDSITAANTIVAFLRASSTTADVTNPTINLMFPGNGLFCASGLYAALSAETGDYIVYYSIG
jgi:hypothetical protein